MKIALIPPVAYLTDSRQTGFQLMLPHMMLEDTVYRRYYSEMCADPDQYVIMDNGAAEGEVPSNEELVEMALKYLPDEFAIPDVLGGQIQTYEKAYDFLAKYVDDFKKAGIKLGYVAQATSIRNTISVIWDVWEEFEKQIDVIYIPRRLVRDDGLDARLRVMKADLPYEYEYHFFGASPLWSEEMRLAKVADLGIRSIDTSLPYNFAFEYSLLDCDSFSVVSRPENYFDLVMDDQQRDIALQNINTVLGWME